jgi:exopolysaccharide production protein ExoZ
MPSSPTLLPIQYLRAIAALMVVWHHATAQVPGLHALFPSGFGAFGVDLFFVISGFIIAFTTYGHEARPTTFFRRRLERIVPLYWTLTLAMVALALLPPHVFSTLSPTSRTALQSLLFIPHFSDTRPNEIWPLLVPGWTLNFEMFFYALFALLLAPGRARTVPLLVGVCVALVALGALVKPHNAIARTYTDARLLEFALGAVIGEWHARGGGLRSAALSWLLMLLGAALLLWTGPAGAGIAPQLIGAGLLVAGCLHPALSARRIGLLHRLGDASYSIYLTHVFTLAALGLVWRKLLPGASTFGSGATFMVLACASSALVGWLCFTWVERPLMQRLRSREKHALARPPAARLG